jgi:7SK snRNA methylphosphate capping enzyme
MYPSDVQVFQFGNYIGYYGYRLNEQGQDPRIGCMKPEWFDGKEVLDIGCNSGVFTIQLGATLPAISPATQQNIF